MKRLYKTLFEVKLMHEFFVTKANGDTPFALPVQSDRLQFLTDSFVNNRESINGDVEFIFPEQFKTVYNDRQLKLFPSYSGFRIAVPVNSKTLPDGSTVFEPMMQLQDDLGIIVMIAKKNSQVNSYSNSRLAQEIPSVYFFSNDPSVNDSTFPFLTSEVAEYNASYAYEQGELALFGAEVKQFTKDGSTDPWKVIKGSHFANERDRLLVPTQFQYTFPNSPTIKEATFTIKNSEGQVVKTIEATDNTGLKSVSIDLREKNSDLLADSKTPLTKKVFSMEVSGSDGYSKNYSLVFVDLPNDRNIWCIVYLQVSTSNMSFNLLDDSNRIITPAPVFEIPIKSRSAYLKYVNKGGKELKLINDLSDYLRKDGAVLISKVPKTLSQSDFQLSKPDGTSPRYVPNPLNYDLKTNNQELLFFEVRVPESDLFPVI